MIRAKGMRIRSRFGSCITENWWRDKDAAIVTCCHGRVWREGANFPEACAPCVGGACGNRARLRVIGGMIELRKEPEERE